MVRFVAGALLLVGCTPERPEAPEVGLLGWDTPLERELLGVDPGEYAGVTLAELVGGLVEARGPQRPCSACHFDDSITMYRPEMGQYDAVELEAWDVLDGRTWSGNYGWAARFVRLDGDALTEKPRVLRVAMQRFLEAEAERVLPLDWATVVDADTLGHEPDPHIAGRTVDDIVNSRVSGRPDGLLCADCHYADAPIPYRPAIARGASSAFGPDAVLDGVSWAQPGGWADIFTDLGPDATVHKPDYLRGLFLKWTDDGAR